MADPLDDPAAIDPAAIDDRLVLADLLMQRGDPLGELISVQHALEALPPEAAGPKRRSLEARAARLLASHHAALFGPLAPHVRPPDGTVPRAPALELVWRGGFADSASIESPGAELELADIYRALRALPLARFLRRLEVGRGDYAGLVTALAADPLPGLRELVLHGQTGVLTSSKAIQRSRQRQRQARFESSHVPAVLDGGALGRLTSLEVLRMQCSAAGLLAMDAPALRHLRLFLAEEAVDELALSSLPSLESLDCYRAAISIDLIERSPRLVRLSAGYCRDLTPVLRWLIESPRLAQLRALSLFKAGLADAELALVTAHADRFAHLEVLDFSSHAFRRATAEAALRRLPRLLVSDGILR